MAFMQPIYIAMHKHDTNGTNAIVIILTSPANYCELRYTFYIIDQPSLLLLPVCHYEGIVSDWGFHESWEERRIAPRNMEVGNLF